MKIGIRFLLHQVKEAGKVCLMLFRIMAPVIVVVKIMQETGIIGYIGILFAPLMRLVGLPGEMGIVWASAIVTNTYGGIAAFVALAPEMHLSVAQTTVIAGMMLISHNLIVESVITRKAGVRLRFMVPFRIVCGLLFGVILNLIYSIGGFLQNETHILWESSPVNDSLWSWGLSQLQNFGMIFVIVFGLIVLMQILEKLGITTLMNRFLKPVLNSMGIGEQASTVTILGMVLGLSYAGGLIIRDVKTGNMPLRDVLFSLSLLGIAHALIEDTLLVMSLGASITGVLVGRVMFSWVIIVLLVLIVRKLPDRIFYRWFLRG